MLRKSMDSFSLTLASSCVFLPYQEDCRKWLQLGLYQRGEKTQREAFSHVRTNACMDTELFQYYRKTLYGFLKQNTHTHQKKNKSPYLKLGHCANCNFCCQEFLLRGISISMVGIKYFTTQLLFGL